MLQLVGYLESPFVRRVAISMQFLGIPYDHRELSIFRDFDEFRALNPLVKVPTLVLEDGQVLSDSGLIIHYLETQVAGRSLMPADSEAFLAASQMVSYALVAMEKVAQIIYETGQRPPEKQQQSWIERLEQQLEGAVALMEASLLRGPKPGKTWLFAEEPCQADISCAAAWRFTQHIDKVNISADDYPAMAAFSERAERLPEFLACPLS